MKKLSALLLALLMSVSLVACGSDKNNGNNVVDDMENAAGDMVDGAKDAVDDVVDGTKDAIDDMTTDYDDMVENGKVHDKDGDLTDGENHQTMP